MEGQLKPLIAERGSLKARLTRFKRFMDVSSSEMHVDALDRKVKSFADLHEKFDKVQAQIEILVTGTDLESPQFDERDEFEAIFFPLITSAERHIEALRGPHQPTPSPSTVTPHSPELHTNAPRMATITLPSFDGTYDHWVRFRDTFLNMVHNNIGLSDIQRFHYLTSALKGDAARIIESLGVSDVNYNIAWSSLKRRFEDPDTLVLHHVNKLLDLPVIEYQSGHALREFIDKANNQIHALGALGEPVNTWDTIVVTLLAKKLDPITYNDWDINVTNSSNRLKFVDFGNFIEGQAKRLDRATFNPQVQVAKQAPKARVHRPSSRSNSVASHVSSTRAQCTLCKGDHFLHQCTKLKSMAIAERHETIKRLHACFNCMQLGHGVKGCTRGTCRKCKGRHHTLLHRDEPVNDAVSAEASGEPVLPCVSNSASIGMEYTMLSTAVVYIEDGNGQRHKCRALLDVGSQAHFLTEDFCDKLNLPRSDISTTVGGLGKTANSIRSRTNLTIRSKCNTFRADISCLVIKNITDNMPNIPTNLLNIPIPPKIVPADPHFYHSSRIDLLIGAGLFWKLLCIGQHKVESSDLIWQKTRLGWVLGGRLTWPIATPHKTEGTCLTVTTNDLHNTISQFWEIEDTQLRHTPFTTDTCEIHFNNTTTRDDNGRYIVRIPFTDKLNELGDSRQQAERRLLNMEHRFTRSPTLHAQYVAFMTEYESLGHMTKITDRNSIERQPSYYLPHHAVFKESSGTTKIRVVFDGSARSSSGVSLNDTQLVGPTVQSDLFSILLRFRTHRIVISADVEKMYRQVEIHPSDRQFQRILWRSNSNAPICTYELNTVTYGTAAAPFLATRVMRQIGLDHCHSYPTASRTIINDFYVDDLLTGCNDHVDALLLRCDLTKILGQAGLSLRKWASNDSRVLDSSHNEQPTVEFKSASNDPKTLGLLWISGTDNLHYAVKDHNLQRITKRNILSEIAQIFDPLGLIAPVVIKAKLFMQHLWKLNISWDETLPQDLHTQWLTFRNDLQDISSIVIPRRAINNGSDSIQLHAFSDASERAYGGAVYLRSVDESGIPTLHLLCAKSRVAPLKPLTVPRLELCGALLVAQLAARVKEALQLSFSHEYYWSDSTIVLAWIKGSPDKWNKFVANRVSEIQQLTSSGCWNHVISVENPADLISRGTNPISLMTSHSWWSGPSWIVQEPSQWPSLDVPIHDIPETRLITNTNCMTSVEKVPNDLFSRYSSYSKLCRIIAYCLKFINALLRKIRGLTPDSTTEASSLDSRFITTRELTAAEERLVKLAQREHFTSEINSLSTGKSLTRKGSLIALSPFLDKTGIIRVGGRLENSSIHYNRRHQMILPAKHPLTTLIIKHEHDRLLHAGPHLTLSSIRLRFWPITGKRAVKQVLSKCVRCFKVNPTSTNYRMGNLPAARITPARAFSTCGIDYAGPFLIKEKGRARATHKTYVCIFVCFVTKAVHIELATDLTSDAFLNCLYRFISRRGRSQCIYSDNGTNFIGARTKLNELGALLADKDHNDRVRRVLSQEQMEWHLIPPYSPHFGGLWEAAVKSMKHHLKRVIGEQRLTFDELYTTLTQVEACLNSRPLYPLSCDPNDLTPLTPGHFLIGDALMAPPQQDLLHLKQNRLNRYQLIQHMVQDFWKRWHREYLHELQQRPKWKIDDSPGKLTKDTLVVLREDNTPPLRWKMGRIVDLHPGSDGISRVVSVKVADGVIKRPVTRICVLPNAESDI